MSMTRAKGGPLCAVHYAGVSPGAPPFFVEGCKRCEENLAAGKTTRDAGPPKGRQYSRRVHRARFFPGSQPKPKPEG